jgi:2-phospho-L-lactate guanylyltransferase
MDAGILPVKRLDKAKQRLGKHFSDEARLQIARALLEDALRLCRATSGFVRWYVVSDDPKVLDRAKAYNLFGFKDESEELNTAVAFAAQMVEREGATSVIIIPSDAPLAYEGDIRYLIDTGTTSDLVLVPSERDAGTNAIYMKPPSLLQPMFGPQSLNAHMSLAGRLGLRCSMLVLPRLSLDIDTLEDIDTFLKRDTLKTSDSSRVLGTLRGLAHDEEGSSP